jgi:hypothetical protein
VLPLISSGIQPGTYAAINPVAADYSIFLAFVGDDEERGARILNIPRSALCGRLDLRINPGDDII